MEHDGGRWKKGQGKGKERKRKGRIKRREERRREKKRVHGEHGERGREESRGQAGPACCPGVPTAG